MNKDQRYFICERKGGCRLSDLNLFLSDNQIFERSVGVIEESRAIKAALSSGWIREVDRTEYNKLINKRKKSLKK